MSESTSKAPSTELTPETPPPQETDSLSAPLEEPVLQLTPDPNWDRPPHPAEHSPPVEGLASVTPTPQKLDLPEAAGLALNSDAPAGKFSVIGISVLLPHPLLLMQHKPPIMSAFSCLTIIQILQRCLSSALTPS